MKKIINFYFKHKKLSLLVIGLLMGTVAYAMPDTVAAAIGEDTSSIIKSINEGFDFLLQITSAWLWPIIMMTGSLLDNDLIFGGVMGERLLGVWVQIRNLVNIIFVLVLLAIAVYNVLPGVGDEAGGMPLGLKTALPKFVLALIAVNFSFIGAKVVLDFTNVLTGAVFALPNATIDGGQFNAQMKTIICGTESEKAPMRPLMCDGNDLSPKGKAFFGKLDRQNITMAYALRFGRASHLKNVKEGIKDLMQLGLNVVFNVVLYVVYAVSHIVLFIVLLARVIVLWVGVVLSPLLALGIVLPSMEGLAGGAGELKEAFIKNAIAPIKIGLVLSIGYIMLDGFEADKANHGDLLAGVTITSVDPNALPTDINDLQQLMIAVAVVAILWIGVFKATDGTAAAAITDTIKQHVGEFGSWAAKLPTYFTVIPTDRGERSFAQMYDLIDQTRRNWTKERTTSPDLTFDINQLVKQLGTVKTGEEAAEIVGRNPNVLTADGGLKALMDSARNNDSKGLANALKDVRDPQNADQIARAIKEASDKNDPYAKAIMSKFKGEQDLARAIEAATAKEEGKKSEAGKNTVSKPEDVVALLEKDPSVLAGKEGAFKDWTEANIRKYREAIKALPTVLQAMVVAIDDDGKVENNLSEITKIRGVISELTSATNNPQGIKDAITRAKNKGIGEAILQKIVDDLPVEADKVAAREALKP